MGRNEKFCIIETALLEKEISLPKRMKYIPKKWRQQKIEDYIQKELPVIKETITYMGEDGMKIIIPYTFYELQQFDERKVKDIFECIIEREAVKNIVAEERLHVYLPKVKMAEESLLPLFYINEILNWVREKHMIALKEQHIVLYDTGGLATGFLLSNLGEDLNHLTIITSRPSYFDGYVDYMYEKTGLIVSVLLNEVETKVEGNIILDLSTKEEQSYSYYPEATVVIQFFYNVDRARKIIANRCDIKYYNQLYLKKGEKRINNKLFQAILCGGFKHMDSAKMEKINKDLKWIDIHVESLGIGI
jgi:hypothetical protein